MSRFEAFLMWLQGLTLNARKRWLRLLGKRFDTALNPTEVVVGAGDGLAFVPVGFSGSFNPEPKGLDRSWQEALGKVQLRAAHQIFALFGLRYIPGEYMVILAAKPDPTEAWVEFCRLVGLSTGKLGHMDPDEVEALRYIASYLVELYALQPELNVPIRRELIEKLKDHDYEAAEERLETVRAVITVLRNGVTLRGTIVFPHFEKFLEIVQTLFADLRNVDPADARMATEKEYEFRECQARFDRVREVLDSQIKYMATNWPKNAWGKTNKPIRDGIIRERAQLEQRLIRDLGCCIPEIIGELEKVLLDLQGFVEEIDANQGGSGFHAPPDNGALEAWMEWRAAAELLGFDEDAEPGAREVRSAFIRLAKKWHPDLRMSSPKERERSEMMMKNLGLARGVLDRAIALGKPKKPVDPTTGAA
ncbi:MAG: J domain-containing protein [bacterium]